jgi:3-deoxy-D-manno-octulosonic-acid transferase
MLRRRVARGKEWADRLPERRGIDPTPRPPGRLIWLHAASVGEAMSVLPVIAQLRAEAGVTVLVTTGTVTSARLMAQRAPDVLHRFVPLDVPRWVERFLDHWRPDAAAFLESELWPSTLAACEARGVRMVLLNARMSARSQAGWGRAPRFARALLGAFDAVWAQSAADAARLQALGARNVSSPGNLKFAAPCLPVDQTELARLRAVLGERPRWLAASTHEGEEAIAAAIQAQLAPAHPGLVTIVAPRHPDRGAALAAALGASRRSAGEDPPASGIWLADTLDELGLLYRLAPIVFVGKSLTSGGGQNPLEPARLGCAVAAGPMMDNHAEAVAALTAVDALARPLNEAELAAWVDSMLRDPVARGRMGQAAKAASCADAELPRRAAALLLSMAGA